MSVLRVSFLAAAGLVSLSFACSSAGDKPAPSRVGTGSDSGVAGDAGKTDSGGGVEDAGKDSSSTATGCGVMDPKTVYLLGALRSDQEGLTVVLDMGTGTFCGVLADNWPKPMEPVYFRRGAIRSDGHVLWAGNNGAYELVSDNLAIGADNSSPRRFSWLQGAALPSANDKVIPTSCAMQVTHVTVRPDTGDPAYGCSNHVDALFTHDGRVLEGAVTIGFGGHWVRQTSATAALEIVDPGPGDGGADAGSSATFAESAGKPFVDVRAKPDGFFIAIGVQDAEELWSVNFDGTATKVGTYAPFPAGYKLLPNVPSNDRTTRAMGPDGVLYQSGYDEASPGGGVVLKRPLLPTVATVIYRGDDTKGGGPIPVGTGLLITGP